MEDLISFMRWHKERGPAPKEEEMEPILDGEPRIDGKLFNARTVERRALYREAYMAALGGGLMVCGVGESWPSIESPVNYCRKIALETVRQWDEMISQLDGEEG